MTKGGDGGSCWNIKKVATYNKDGQLLAVFESVTECAEYYGISGTTSISAVCNNNTRTCSGMMFVSFDDVPCLTITPYSKRNRRNVPIYKLDLTGNIIKRYSSISEACKEGFLRSGIIGCANGTYKQSNGFIWRYEKDIAASIGKPMEPMNSLKGKYILQFTYNGQIIFKKKSWADAARKNEISSYKLIHKALDTETHYSSGFKWYRSDNVNMEILK